jgi:hypothetical protein
MVNDFIHDTNEVTEELRDLTPAADDCIEQI